MPDRPLELFFRCCLDCIRAGLEEARVLVSTAVLAMTIELLGWADLQKREKKGKSEEL
jgi:hypothetical protein